MASNISVKDASAATITMKTTDNAGVHTSHQNVDAVIPGTGATNLGKAEDSAHASGDVGVMALAVRRDTLAASSGTTGDYEPLQTDANGQLRIVPEVKPGPATSGGCSSYSKLSAGTSADEVSVKATPGQLYGIRVSNTNASARYLKIYNSATAPTLGAGTPVRRIKVAGNSERDIVFPVGLEMTTGIAFALTTGAADSDANRVAANEIIVELEYK